MSDLRTQRLMIEVTFDADQTAEPAQWDWNGFIDGRPHESVTVIYAERSFPQRPTMPVGRKS